MAEAEEEVGVAVVGGAAAAGEVAGDHPVPVDPDRAHRTPDQAVPHPTEDMVAVHRQVRILGNYRDVRSQERVLGPIKMCLTVRASDHFSMLNETELCTRTCVS